MGARVEEAATAARFFARLAVQARGRNQPGISTVLQEGTGKGGTRARQETHVRLMEHAQLSSNGVGVGTAQHGMQSHSMQPHSRQHSRQQQKVPYLSSRAAPASISTAQHAAAHHSSRAAGETAGSTTYLSSRAAPASISTSPASLNCFSSQSSSRPLHPQESETQARPLSRLVAFAALHALPGAAATHSGSHS
jgi:hypothetical protein